MILNKKPVYAGVIDIPEAKIGECSIAHVIKPAGTTLARQSGRTAFLGGHGAGPVTFDVETCWHQLASDADGVWMTDLPIEQWQMDEALKPVRSGRVLVGGLGLGIAAMALALRPAVREVVVVEKSADVIALVAPTLGRGPALPAPAAKRARAKLRVIHADLFEFLDDAKRRGDRYDWAFYDIWQSDGETTFHQIVAPLLAKSINVVRHTPICWNEDVMRAQLWLALDSRRRFADPAISAATPSLKAPTLDELATPRGNARWDWCAPFFRWVRDARPPEDRAQIGARLYASQYGREAFVTREVRLRCATHAQRDVWGGQWIAAPGAVSGPKRLPTPAEDSPCR
jgi:hypothetical protein